MKWWAGSGARVEMDLVYAQALQKEGLCDYFSVMAYPWGQIYKRNEFRSVVRVKPGNISGPGFFLKRHFKTAVKDFLERLLKLKRPRSAGRKEWEAAQRFRELGIPTFTPVAWGERSFFLFPRDSFFISLEVSGAEQLEDYLVKMFTPPLDKPRLHMKKELIQRVAELARTMHNAGLNHRDFYLGHILIKEGNQGPPSLYVIDLQRVESHKKVGKRLRVKDLAALNFTASSQAVSSSDRLRFYKHYWDRAKLTKEDKAWIRAVVKKTEKIKEHTEKLLARRRLKATL